MSIIGTDEMRRQTSIQLTPITDHQAQALRNIGFGSFTDIVRVAIDRMYRDEITANLRGAAEHRVKNSLKLQKFSDIIFYDWPEGDEHWEWIVTAPENEIIDWASQDQSEENDATR